MVKKAIDWDLGIVVHLFCVLIEVDQLAGGYFPICDNYVLCQHEECTVKFTSCYVPNVSDVIFLDC